MGRKVFQTYGKEDGVCIEGRLASKEFNSRLAELAMEAYEQPDEILLPPGVKTEAAQTRTRRKDSEIQILLPTGVNDNDDDEDDDDEDEDREILLPPGVGRR